MQAYVREMEIFIDTILKGCHSAMPASDARRVVEMATMATESYRTGKVVYNNK